MATKPIPVRFDPSTIARLDRTAKRLGTNRAALIKFCAQTFVADFEAGGGTAILPPNWREIFRRLNQANREPVREAPRKAGQKIRRGTSLATKKF